MTNLPREAIFLIISFFFFLNKKRVAIFSVTFVACFLVIDVSSYLSKTWTRFTLASFFTKQKKEDLLKFFYKNSRQCLQKPFSCCYKYQVCFFFAGFSSSSRQTCCVLSRHNVCLYIMALFCGSFGAQLKNQTNISECYCFVAKKPNTAKWVARLETTSFQKKKNKVRRDCCYVSN